MVHLVPTEAQRELLKKPFGQLIVGNEKECTETLREIVDKAAPPRLVLVGDTIARNAVNSGIRPDVIIIDNMEKRKEALAFQHEAAHIFRTKNPAGYIEIAAWRAIEEAIMKGNSLVIVEGEEDLLTLPAVSSSPASSIVAYGQPNQGIVVVRVDAAKKEEVNEFVGQMEKRD